MYHLKMIILLLVEILENFVLDTNYDYYNYQHGINLKTSNVVREHMMSYILVGT